MPPQSYLLRKELEKSSLFYGNSRQYIERQIKKHGYFKHDKYEGNEQPIRLQISKSAALQYATERAVRMPQGLKQTTESPCYITVRRTPSLEERLVKLPGIEVYTIDYLKPEEFEFHSYE